MENKWNYESPALRNYRERAERMEQARKEKKDKEFRKNLAFVLMGIATPFILYGLIILAFVVADILGV